MTNDVNWFIPCKKSIKTREKEGLFLSKNTLFYLTVIFIWIMLIVIERGIILVKLSVFQNFILPLFIQALQVAMGCWCSILPSLWPQTPTVKRKLISANNFSQAGEDHMIEKISHCSTNQMYLEQCFSGLFRQGFVWAKLL